MKAILLFSFLLPFLAHAELRSAKALTTALKSGTFEARVTDGYHFNDKAPNEIQIGETSLKPTKLEKRRIEFQVPKGSQGTAALYVCDDAVTYCETHHVPVGNAKTETGVGKAAIPKPPH